MKKTVMITGATSGFGKAMAEVFATNGFSLILTGRRSERLQQLKEQLENKNSANVLTLVFDVQNKAAVFAAIERLPDEWKNIDILINNAGLALGRDYFDEADLHDWETMIDTNLKGLLYVSRAVLPFMVKNAKGHIINIGSVAGKEVYEKGNVYCASKHAVDAISKSMRIDLLRHNIKVTAIHPGAVETEFSIVRFKGDESMANEVYQGYQPLQPKDVADVTYFCATLPEHYCINDLVITPTAQATALYFNK